MRSARRLQRGKHAVFFFVGGVALTLCYVGRVRFAKWRLHCAFLV